MWSPSKSAAQLNPWSVLPGKQNGIDLVVGGVYILWDPTGQIVTEMINGVPYNSLCKVALLYIDGVNKGDGTNHNISNVSFLIAYPIN